MATAGAVAGAGRERETAPGSDRWTEGVAEKEAAPAPPDVGLVGPVSGSVLGRAVER
ncbi:hypothetical protein [Streptomyces crystallinus]|uniref:hypothetical protein n=1 Tax=Streptomyces crystallinus TaxID=68191 RepID=UPI0031D89AC9